MSVTLLLCEGQPKGRDIRLISAMLGAAAAKVRAGGSRSALRELVKSHRAHLRSCAALADGDFPRNPATWAASDQPHEWHDGGAFIGWQWRRKEVENYFLAPEVLQHVFAWGPTELDRWRKAVETAARGIAQATAARMSIVALAPRKTRVETKVPLDQEASKLRTVLSKRAMEYNTGVTLPAPRLLKTFDTLRPRCAATGDLFPHALELFAGKDLMQAVAHQKGIRDLHPALADEEAWVEEVLARLETTRDCYTWLPEWAALRAAVEAWSP